MQFSASRIWRQLPDEIRISASKLFWTEPTKEQKQLLVAALAKATNVREMSVRRAPLARLISWTAATLSLPDQIANNLLQDYLLHDHRATIVSYLDLLGIPHSDGMIEEGFGLASMPKERVQDAARTLLAPMAAQAVDFTLSISWFKVGPGRRLKKSWQPGIPKHLRHHASWRPRLGKVSKLREQRFLLVKTHSGMEFNIFQAGGSGRIPRLRITPQTDHPSPHLPHQIPRQTGLLANRESSRSDGIRGFTAIRSCSELPLD